MNPWTSEMLSMNLLYALIGLAALAILGLKIFFLSQKRKIRKKRAKKSINDLQSS